MNKYQAFYTDSDGAVRILFIDAESFREALEILEQLKPLDIISITLQIEYS